MTYYDEIADGYDELHKQEQLAKIRIIKEHMKIKPTDRLLDIGCGPCYGDWGCKVTGIDPSVELLRSAKVKTFVGYAEALPFPDDSFDIVVSVTAMQNFNDINKAFMEMQRVCKGRFALTFLKKTSKKQMIENLINERFDVIKRIEQEHDIIYITKYI